MNNIYFWSVLVIGGILIYLKIRSDRKRSAETDDQFLARKLAGSNRLLWVVIAISGPGALMLAWAGFSQFAEYWWLGLMGLAGSVMVAFLVRYQLRWNDHPVVKAVKANPAALTDLKIRPIRMLGRKASEIVQLFVDKKMVQIYLDNAHERSRFLRILHQRAPHLVPEEPALIEPDSMVRSGLKSLGGAVYVVVVIAAIVVFRIYTKSGNDDARQPSFRDQLRQYAVELNQTLPRVLDQATRMDSGALQGGGFFFNYTLLELQEQQFDRRGFNEAMTPRLVQSACADANARAMLDHDVPVTFAYHAPSGERMSSITVTAKDCPD